MYMTKDFLDSLVSAKTKKSYRHGLKVFEEFYRKPLQMLLEEKDSGRIIEILRLVQQALPTKQLQSSGELHNPVLQVQRC